MNPYGAHQACTRTHTSATIRSAAPIPVQLSSYHVAYSLHVCTTCSLTHTFSTTPLSTKVPLLTHSRTRAPARIGPA
jgi:hypothetical protein